MHKMLGSALQERTSSEVRKPKSFRIRTSQNAPITRLESALPNSLDLKPFRIRTYKKWRGGGDHLLTKAAQVLGSPAAPEIIRGQTEKKQDDSNREIAKLDRVAEGQIDCVPDDGGGSQNENERCKRVARYAIGDRLALRSAA